MSDSASKPIRPATPAQAAVKVSTPIVRRPVQARGVGSAPTAKHGLSGHNE